MSPENNAQNSNSNPPQKKISLVATTGESVGADDCDMLTDEKENVDDPVSSSSPARPTSKNVGKKKNYYTTWKGHPTRGFH